jgi:hypothetical protein
MIFILVGGMKCSPRSTAMKSERIFFGGLIVSYPETPGPLEIEVALRNHPNRTKLAIPT